jgi:lipid-A-disaccharide synthase
MDSRPLRIALVAGEASGDLLGAGLITELRKLHPGAEFAGIGGPRMQAEEMSAWYDASELSVMGLSEVLKHLPRLLSLRSKLYKRLLEWQPDVFVGIDAPDFNLGLERKLRKAGIRTVHYVSPSVWAWRESRAAKIGRSAQRVLCLFPMEPPIYARHGVDARFVGHPLADSFELHPNTAAARATLGVGEGGPVLAMLPGSRAAEIERLLPTFLEAVELLRAQLPELQVLVPAADARCRALIEARLGASPPRGLRVLDGHAHEAMIASDIVLLASGTAALEAMLAKRPMVVAYRISALTYRVVMGLGMMHSNHYSLPNVLANEPVVPELMQGECTPRNLADALARWLSDAEACETLERRFLRIHERLRGGGSAAAARAVSDLIGTRK